MKHLITILLIFLSLEIKAHYPIDLLNILARSELVVTGIVTKSNNDFFWLKVDTVVYGDYREKEVMIKYKKDVAIMLENRDIAIHPNYKDYKINQKLLIFLEHCKENDTVWVSTGTYDEGEMILSNDTIFFSDYHNIDFCLFSDFTNSLKLFDYYFVYSFDRKEYITRVKQVRKNDAQFEHCRLDFYTELINILRGDNCKNVFKKNQEWMYDFNNRFFHPVCGLYENYDRLLKGRYKNGKRVGKWYVYNNEYHYKNGKVIKELIFNTNGKLLKKIVYYNNLNKKLEVKYYDNGKIESLKKYRKNPKVRYKVINDENGINVIECNNGLKKYCYFSTSGKLLRQEKYNFNEYISCEY